LTEFNNPIEINPDIGIQVTTFDNLMSKIDQSVIVPLSVSTPANIADSIVRLDSGSSVVAQQSGLRFDFSSPIPLVAGCIINIKVPESFSTDLDTNLKYLYAYGLFGSMKSLPFTSSGNIIEIQDACSTLLMNEMIGSIKIKYFKNPDSVRDSGDFEIMIKDMNSNMIAKSFQPF
jgi:hypothetical protein